MSTATIIRAHIHVSGFVQGVNFRWSTQRQARALGLTGWVRNLSDGRVEVVFEGQREVVKQAVSWCYSGPPSASVNEVEVDYLSATNEFTDFRVLW